MVGFQTNLKWSEQKRIFRMIPGLEKAEFVRFGVMHRNTFLESPKLLLPTFQFLKRERLFAAGQITGTEGYAAAAAGGVIAGINAALLAKGKKVDYEGATGVTFTSVGEAEGSFLEQEIKGGKFKTKNQR